MRKTEGGLLGTRSKYRRQEDMVTHVAAQQGFTVYDLICGQSANGGSVSGCSHEDAIGG